MIEIVRTGPLTTVQDLGRPGWAGLGVSPSGAADLGALRLANRLVGNAESAACLEVTLGGLLARFEATVLVALTGAHCPVRVGDRPGFVNGPLTVRAGESLLLGSPSRGLRTYLAVRGGIDVPPVFGSRSTDLLSGIGPAPVTPGARLPLGGSAVGLPAVDHAPVPALPADLELRVLAGPRDDWVSAEARHLFARETYVVSARSNRVGVRLDGAALTRTRHEELPSEGIVRGAVQIPPDGRPVLFLADHPVTGGYPVIGVVEPADTDLLGQARPGQRVSLRWAPR